MHVYDPMSSLGRTVWRFLLRRAAGYAAHDLSDEIGANSCPCTFHWLWYLLGQPRFSKWLHRELVLRLRRPERARSARALAADAARKKLDAPSAAATPPPGPGRARTAEQATARAPETDADSGPTRSHRGRPVSAVDARTVVGAARRAAGAAERRGAAAAARGLQRRGPARPSRGRARAAVTRRVACVRSARSAHGPKTLALRARARGKKRRAGGVLGRRRRPRENCVRKGVLSPFLDSGFTPAPVRREPRPRGAVQKSR